MKKIAAKSKILVTASLLLLSYSSFAQFHPVIPPADRFDIKFFIHENHGGGWFTQIPAHTGGNGEHGSPALVAYVGNQANDRISSIWFNQNSDQCLLVYEDQNFLGRNYVIGHDVMNLNNYPYLFNDKISSYIMFKPSPYANAWSGKDTACKQSVAELYDSGAPLPPYEFDRIYSLPFGQIVPRLGYINDKVSRVVVPPSGCLKVWIDSPPNNSANYSSWYNNPDMTFTEGLFTLSSYGLNDKISAVELKSCY